MAQSSRHWRAWALVAWAFAALGAAQPAHAESQTAEAHAFIEQLWPAARARGISRAVFERATAGFSPDSEVVELAGRQPEVVKLPGTYMAELITDARIDAGRQLAIEHSRLLDAIEAAYGVDRHVLLAIWGIESAYGTRQGGRAVIRSLATLAMTDERRAPFWRKELLAALRMLQDGAATPDKLVGSWAGAMGHTQFIPSTFSAHAVDFDKDGRRDIWNSVADALASTANYLKWSGWTRGMPWGLEVVLPARFDYAWSAPGRTRPLADWLAAGVQIPRAGGALSLSAELQLMLPAGARGPAFLATTNFRAILKYNNSTSYALSVAHLADRIADGAPLVGAWPANDSALTLAEREELQRLLATRGHPIGGLDGIIGDQTRAAIRATQRTLNLAEDGHPTSELLRRLRDPGAR